MVNGLSQKEVVIGDDIEKAQFSCVENGKTDPSYLTTEKITKALGCTLSELFNTNEDVKYVQSRDKL